MAPWQHQEPSINELMKEPIIRAVMSRDAVEESDLRQLLRRVGETYQASNLSRRAH